MTKLQPMDDEPTPNKARNAAIVVAVVLVLLAVLQLCGDAGAVAIGGGW